jgi:hypothetical protein
LIQSLLGAREIDFPIQAKRCLRSNESRRPTKTSAKLAVGNLGVQISTIPADSRSVYVLWGLPLKAEPDANLSKRSMTSALPVDLAGEDGPFSGRSE